MKETVAPSLMGRILSQDPSCFPKSQGKFEHCLIIRGIPYTVARLHHVMVARINCFYATELLVHIRAGFIIYEVRALWEDGDQTNASGPSVGFNPSMRR